MIVASNPVKRHIGNRGFRDLLAYDYPQRPLYLWKPVVKDLDVWECFLDACFGASHGFRGSTMAEYMLHSQLVAVGILDTVPLLFGLSVRSSEAYMISAISDPRDLYRPRPIISAWQPGIARDSTNFKCWAEYLVQGEHTFFWEHAQVFFPPPAQTAYKALSVIQQLKE